MAWAHGKNTIITLAANTIADANTSEITKEADEEDMGVYGDSYGMPEGSIIRHTVTMGGKYKVGATGAGAVIQPLVGTNVAMTVKPEGTGTGKPLHTLTVLVKKYVQTQPWAGYITWSAEFSAAGNDVITTQA